MPAPNFQDRAKKLIITLYESGTPDDHDVKMTTRQIYSNLCTIIPATAIDEHEVVEIMEELGFTPGYEQKKEEIKREVPGQKDAHGNPLIETDIITYDDLVYYWYLKKR